MGGGGTRVAVSMASPDKIAGCHTDRSPVLTRTSLGFPEVVRLRDNIWFMCDYRDTWLTLTQRFCLCVAALSKNKTQKRYRRYMPSHKS